MVQSVHDVATGLMLHKLLMHPLVRLGDFAYWNFDGAGLA